ncbi:MAG: hypothetical protein SVY41_00305 [Candidatus Nanohaloarchaea archaeon]|nr:hypothetical protein [Candidatus Nanohaloarchaea archaeon]
MDFGRTGQTQVLTAVLLGGILIAGVSAAYVWGLPILQKNQDVNNAEQSLSDMKELSRAISSVASSGGSRSITVNLADGSLTIDADEDIITYRALTTGAYVSTRMWLPLNENDMQGVNRSTGQPMDGYGIRGVDEPVLLVGKAKRVSDGFLTRYRIIPRRMLETGTGQTFQINLVQDGNLQASNGQHTVVLRSGQQETETGAGIDGGTLRRQSVLIRIS